MLSSKEREHAQTVSDLQTQLEAAKKEAEEAGRVTASLKEESGQVRMSV